VGVCVWGVNSTGSRHLRKLDSHHSVQEITHRLEGEGGGTGGGAGGGGEITFQVLMSRRMLPPSDFGVSLGVCMWE
jgi:hypothetical protein